MSRVLASARRLRLYRNPVSPLPAALRFRGMMLTSVPSTSVCAAPRQRSTLSFARALSSSPAPSYSLDDVVSWLDAELALDVSALRVTGLLDGAVGDYFVFATARSRVHMRRVAKGVRHELKERGVTVSFGEASKPFVLDATGTGPIAMVLKTGEPYFVEDAVTCNTLQRRGVACF